jgi:2-isopropylmalate synthase
MENLDFVIETFLACADAGADIINMPNTVERYRPYLFTNMVEKVALALPERVLASVHCHNDLGMATATSVESYFSGAVQIETCMNGIGERAGNANLFEIAAVLNNCGVDTGLNLKLFARTAKRLAELSATPIHAKAPLFGEEVVMHRSGIHQDGAAKTKNMEKGAYRPMDFSVIGRSENDRMGFTSQSGRSALTEILAQAGITLTTQQAVEFIKICKAASEAEGELSPGRILELYSNAD